MKNLNKMNKQCLRKRQANVKYCVDSVDSESDFSDSEDDSEFLLDSAEDESDFEEVENPIRLEVQKKQIPEIKKQCKVMNGALYEQLRQVLSSDR